MLCHGEGVLEAAALESLLEQGLRRWQAGNTHTRWTSCAVPSFWMLDPHSLCMPLIKMIRAWHQLHQRELEDAWAKVRARQAPGTIAPLS